MATDTTETTFVRCPACRSLVPAVSTRCRMCGATLDAGAAAEAAQPQPSGRVRQQTLTTASSSDLADQVGKVREEMGQPPAPEVKAAPPQEPPAPQQKATDPLAGYLDDEEDLLEDEDLLDDDDFEDDFEDDFDDEVTEEAAPQPEPEPVPEPPAPPVREAKPAPATKKEEPAPKVVVDQGKTKAARPGLSFGAKPADGSQRRFDVAQPPKRMEAPAAKEVPMAEEAPAREPVQLREKTKDVIKKGEQLGALYAWLVSYAQEDGNSIELRQGRFFVSAEQLRATDMVFADGTISTPHAMFTISEDDGIVIQDLKSERGVFVREKGATAYRREYDSARLRHGDWVRFGDLEFLVSVIATAKE